MRIKYLDRDFRHSARVCVCVRVRIRIRVHIHAHLRKQESSQAISKSLLRLLLEVACVMTLACLVRCRAWVNKDAPRWSTRDVYDRDLR